MRKALPYHTFKDFMRVQGLTQEDLAKILNTSQSEVSRLLRGHRRMTVTLAFKLSQISGLPMEQLALEFKDRRVA